MAMAIQPIRYGQHLLALDVSCLIYTRTGAELDCSSASYVDGFQISGTQPAGTQRRAAFNVDGVWYKVAAQGNVLLPLETQELTAESVISEGNTVEELAAVTPIPGFVGKRVGVALALQADDPDGAMPTLRLAIKIRAVSDLTEMTETSPEYALGNPGVVIRLDAMVKTENGGSATAQARVMNLSGVWSDWAALASFSGQSATRVQFKAVLNAPTPGSSSATIEQATVQYRSGSGLVSGSGVAEICSITEDWGFLIRGGRIGIKHAPLVHALMRAYVSFRERPTVVIGENIGIGNGEKKTFPLQNPTGVKCDTVKLYFDGTRIYSGFEVNTEVGRITCLAPAGVVVTADYEYGWTDENWREMLSAGTISTLEYDRTEFKYDLPAGEAAKGICAVKIALEMTEGRIEGEVVGTGGGTVRTYTLERYIRDANISVYADGQQLHSSDWTMGGDGKSVRAIAPEGTEVSVFYDWISETPVVYQFIAVFSE